MAVKTHQRTSHGLAIVLTGIREPIWLVSIPGHSPWFNCFTLGARSGLITLLLMEVKSAA